MGNLRSNMTDEEWDAMEEKCLGTRVIKVNPSLGIDKETARKIQQDIFDFGQAVVKEEYKIDKDEPCT